MGGAPIDEATRAREFLRNQNAQADRARQFLRNQAAANASGSRLDQITAGVGNVPSAPPPHDRPRPQTLGEKFVEGGFDPHVQGLAAHVIDYLPAYAATAGSLYFGGPMAKAYALGKVATAVSSVVGATLGGGVGSYAQHAAAGEVPNMKPGEALGEGIRQGKYAAAGEAVGAAAPVQRFIKWMGGKPLAEAVEVRQTMASLRQDFADELMRAGKSPAQALKAADEGLLPAEFGMGELLKDVDNWFANGKGMFGAARQRWTAARERVLVRAIDAHVDNLGPMMSEDDIAELIGSTIAKNKKEALGEFGAMHEVVANRLRARHVPAVEQGIAGAGAEAGLTNAAAPMKLVAEDTGGTAGLVDLRKIRDSSLARLRNYVGGIGAKAPDPEKLASLVKGLEDYPDYAPYEEVQIFRSQLGEAIGKAAGPDGNQKFVAAGKELYDDLTVARDNALKAYDRVMGPRVGSGYIKAFDMQKDADAGYKAVQRHFQSKFANKFLAFAADDPRAPDIGRKILQPFTGPGQAGNLAGAREFLGGEKSPGWRAMRSFVVNDALERSTVGGMIDANGTRVGGRYSGELMLKNLLSKRRLGEDAADIVLGKEKAPLISLIRGLEYTQRLAPGSAAIQKADVGIIINSIAGAAAGGNISAVSRAGLEPARWLLTMAGFRKLISTPEGVKLLSQGVKASPKTRLGTEITSRLIGDLVRGPHYVEMPDSASEAQYGAMRKQGTTLR